MTSPNQSGSTSGAFVSPGSEAQFNRIFGAYDFSLDPVLQAQVEANLAAHQAMGEAPVKIRKGRLAVATLAVGIAAGLGGALVASGGETTIAERLGHWFNSGRPPASNTKTNPIMIPPVSNFTLTPGLKPADILEYQPRAQRK